MEVKQGWQCPLCNTVYAPDVESCGCANAIKLELNLPKLECTCDKGYQLSCPIHAAIRDITSIAGIGGAVREVGCGNPSCFCSGACMGQVSDNVAYYSTRSYDSKAAK